MEERVAHMRANRKQEWTKSLMSSATEYRECMQKATQSAITFLDISEEDYVNSFKTLLEQSKDAQ